MRPCISFENLCMNWVEVSKGICTWSSYKKVQKGCRIKIFVQNFPNSYKVKIIVCRFYSCNFKFLGDRGKVMVESMHGLTRETGKGPKKSVLYRFEEVNLVF